MTDPQVGRTGRQAPGKARSALFREPQTQAVDLVGPCTQDVAILARQHSLILTVDAT